LVALLGNLNEQRLPSRLGDATCVRTRAPVPDLGSQIRRHSQVSDTNRDGHASVGAIASPTQCCESTIDLCLHRCSEKSGSN